MGTITFSVNDATDGTLSKAFAVADADITRIVTSYQAQANTYYSTPSNPVVATRGQVLSYIAFWLRDSLSSHVYQTEYASAQGGVTPPVPPVLT